jgi:hypothetical protein
VLIVYVLYSVICTILHITHREINKNLYFLLYYMVQCKQKLIVIFMQTGILCPKSACLVASEFNILLFLRKVHLKPES